MFSEINWLQRIVLCLYAGGMLFIGIGSVSAAGRNYGYILVATYQFAILGVGFTLAAVALFLAAKSNR